MSIINNFELYKDQIGLNEVKVKSIKFSKKLLENTIKYILEEYIKQKLSIKYDYNEYFKLDENLFIIKSYEKGHRIRFTKNQQLNLDKVIVLLVEYEIIDEETFKITKIYFKKRKEFK